MKHYKKRRPQCPYPVDKPVRKRYNPVGQPFGDDPASRQKRFYKNKENFLKLITLLPERVA